MKPRSRSISRPIRPNRLPPLPLAFFFILGIGTLSLLPRVSADPWLAGAFRGAAGVLLVLLLVLRSRAARERRTLRYELVAIPSHYVQAMMQACVYAYWGWYWPQVYDHLPHIAAQLLFAYTLDMLLCWFRRDKWVLGFGQFPIILSTNLFMWFRDDWFWLQFLMVATGVLGKQFVQWNRDGRPTHVFNPSALSLFVFSIGLIATGSTGITWGPEIAASLNLPPRIYLEIFLVGLVVQALFSVTLVTLSAAAMLFALNLGYTGLTGTYHFIITNIPIAVFLGLHLLVTDPATSPRTGTGRILFGALYGAATFGLFGLLGWLDIPTFYDKLLCVPVLNLMVRQLDQAARALGEGTRRWVETPQWSPRALNFASIAVWIALFVTMTGSGFLGNDHPGRDPGFWQRACDEGRRNGCRHWVQLLEFSCRHDAEACHTLGSVHLEGQLVPRDVLGAIKSFARACDRGSGDGCASLQELARADGRGALEQACADGDSDGCFILGELHFNGHGIPQDHPAALELFGRSCDGGLTRGCARVGLSYLLGEGTTADPAMALARFEKACRGGHAGSCSTAGSLHRRGTAGPANEALATHWLRRACDLGSTKACRPGERPRTPRRQVELDIELLKLGG